MGKLMEANRLSSAALWTQLTRELNYLRSASQGQLTYFDRRGMAQRAYECAKELRLRGEQLTLLRDD